MTCPAPTSVRRIVAPIAKPTARQTVVPVARQTVAPIVGRIAAPTVGPIVALASDRGVIAPARVQKAARSGGRLRHCLLVALLAAVVAPVARATWDEATGHVDHATHDETQVFSAEFALDAGVESYRNPVALIDDDGTAVALARSARRVSSPFREAALNVDLELPFAPSWAWTGSYALESRRSTDLPGLDHDRHTLTLGVLRESGDSELGAELLFEHLEVGSGDFRRRAFGLRIDYLPFAGDSAAEGLSLEWKRYRHGFPDDIEDGDRLSVAWTRHSGNGLGGGWRTKLVAAALFNRWGYDDFAYRELSARVERVFVPAPEWTFTLGVTPRWRRFGAPAPGTDFTRDDRRLTGVATLSRALGEHASLQCEAELGRLYSNDALVRSRWNTLACGLRLVF